MQLWPCKGPTLYPEGKIGIGEAWRRPGPGARPRPIPSAVNGESCGFVTRTTEIKRIQSLSTLQDRCLRANLQSRAGERQAVRSQTVEVGMAAAGMASGAKADTGLPRMEPLKRLCWTGPDLLEEMREILFLQLTGQLKLHHPLPIRLRKKADRDRVSRCCCLPPAASGLRL